jgi:hypothetical protein
MSSKRSESMNGCVVRAAGEEACDAWRFLDGGLGGRAGHRGVRWRRKLGVRAA